MTMSAQKSFDYACVMYEELKDIVRELSALCKSVSPSFSFEIAMRECDYILQTEMLLVAAADGIMLDIEKQFIKKITDYGDLVNLINDKTDKEILTWDLLFVMNANQVQELMVKILEMIKLEISDFVTPFATVDAVTPRDYKTEISEKMEHICAALATCDGDETESEDFRSELNTSVGFHVQFFDKVWDSVFDAAKRKLK